MSTDETRRSIRRARLIERADLPPGPARDLRDVIYDLYLAADAPTLTQIATEIAGAEDLPGAPGRDVISAIVSGRGLPATQQDAVSVAVALARGTARETGGDSAALAERVRALWVTAAKAAATSSPPTQRTPSGPVSWSETPVRVRDADPRHFGVHGAIKSPGAEGQPTYVPRDIDHDLRATLCGDTAAFALLVGSSCAGKTRTAFEAVLDTVPHWWILQPSGPDQLEELAEAPPARTVVWLDELQRYLLPGRAAATATAIAALLKGSDPILVVGTAWPQEYAITTISNRFSGQIADSAGRALWNLAHVFSVDSQLSTRERGRAALAARTDPRIRRAFESGDGGLTQVLAAGPELLMRWAQAPDPAAKALISAAVDITRLGVTTALTPEMLAGAAAGYLPAAARATASPGWLDDAVAYATEPIHGDISALLPVDGGIGVVAGYRVADYLLQEVGRLRRSEPIPDTTWEVLLGYVHAPDILLAAATRASRRLLYRHAEDLYRRAVDLGADRAIDWLADLLLRMGRADAAIAVLLPRPNSKDGFRLERLAHLLLDAGRVDDARALLRAEAHAGSRVQRLAVQLAHRRAVAGQIDQAVAWINVADSDGFLAHSTGLDHDAGRLAALLAEAGHVDEALAVLRPVAAGGDHYAEAQVVALLVRHGRIDELRARADSKDFRAAEMLADLLARTGRMDELRVRAGGSNAARRRLIEVMTASGRQDEAVALLREWTDGDDSHSPYLLTEYLVRLGREDEAIAVLRPDADAGDWSSQRRLAELLVRAGDLAELRRRSAAGERPATEALVSSLLADQKRREAAEVLNARIESGEDALKLDLAKLWEQDGRVDDALALVDSMQGHPWGASFWAAEILIREGRLSEGIEKLRSCAENGYGEATKKITKVLVEYERVDELFVHVDRFGVGLHELVDLLVAVGRPDDALSLLAAKIPRANQYEKGRLNERFASLLADLGRLDQLWALARSGGYYAASKLAEIFAETRQVDGLQAVADLGIWSARRELARLLADASNTAELQARADSGDWEAGEQLVKLLRDGNDLDGLRAEVAAGTPGADDAYIKALSGAGRVDEAESLRRLGLDVEQAAGGQWW